jgi:hypothetical protein
VYDDVKAERQATLHRTRSNGVRAEDWTDPLAEYKKAMTDFEVIHDRIIQHLRDHTKPTPDELQQMERARLLLSETHRSISSKVAGR